MEHKSEKGMQSKLPLFYRAMVRVKLVVRKIPLKKPGGWSTGRRKDKKLSCQYPK
jgi:hypothetical protein